MTDTRRKLLDAAMATLRDRGIAGASARVIAATAEVNQALVFYHFGSVADLIAAACLYSATQQVEAYRPRFTQAKTLRELLAFGQELHAEQSAAGQVTVLAQVLAGARGDPSLADAARQALQVWIAELGGTVERLLRDSPLADAVSPDGIAHAVAAAFIGVELYEGADPQGAAAAFAALEQIASLVELVDELGPVARRALRRRSYRR